MHAIKRLRNLVGLTQSELAKRLRVSQQTVSRVENAGSCSKDVAIGVLTSFPRDAKRLGITIDTLLRGK
jgi:transcriptional regulator with XRE-family HTH domain